MTIKQNPQKKWNANNLSKVLGSLNLSYDEVLGLKPDTKQMEYIAEAILNVCRYLGPDAVRPWFRTPHHSMGKPPLEVALVSEENAFLVYNYTYGLADPYCSL